MAGLKRQIAPAAPDDPLDAIRERLDRIEEALERQQRTGQLVEAIVRRLFLDGVELPPHKRLWAARFGVTSQNGEDGLLLEVFRRIGATDRRFVEIGCGTNGGNSGFLAREVGWSGLMVDGNPGAVEKVALRYASERVATACHLVTRETINDILTDGGFTGELDLLSIDIDGNDFWVWEAVTAATPRVVIIEYNYLFGPDASVTIPYDAGFRLSQAPTRAYRGASLEAMVRLGRRKGYRLIATERVNAVFLRDDVEADLPTLTADVAYQAPRNRGLDVFSRKIGRRGLPLVPVDAEGRPGAPVPAEQAQ